jgi:hypothetical protein
MSDINWKEIRKGEHQMDVAHWKETFVFDIETMGVPNKVKEFGKPYPSFEEPKYGNLKDPIKRQAYYEEKHQAWVDGEVKWWEKQYDRAALDAVTGRVVAIGYLFPYADNEGDGELLDNCIMDGLSQNGVHDLEEIQILTRFWEYFKNATGTYGHIIGHNIEGFDLPFLMQRSWQLGVPVAPNVMHKRYFHRNVVDTMKVWCCHGFKETISLNNLAKLLNIGHKMSNYHALQFAPDWLGEDKDTAEFYLRTDLSLTHGCYEKLYKT